MTNDRSQVGSIVILSVLLVAAIVLLTHVKGCSGNIGEIPAPPANPPGVSDTIAINVYLDGSGSIAHFLKAPPKPEDHLTRNYMRDLIDKIGTTLSNPPGAGWEDKKLTYYLFGAKVGNPVDDLSSLNTNPERFFNAPKTEIETAVNHVQPADTGVSMPELKIIITDLYQSNGLMNQPANALASKYLKDDKNAVAVLAVRNPFDGLVEDLPGSAPNQTFADAANSMPFYVIVAGPTADVRHAVQVLLERTGLDDAMRKHLGAEFLFTRTPEPRREDPIMTESAGRYEVKTQNYEDRHIPQVNLSSGVLGIQWKDSLKLDRHVVSVAEGEELQPKALVAGPHGELTESTEALTAIESCGGTTLLCERIDRSKLPKAPATYVLRFDRVFTRPSETLAPDSEAVKPWNIEKGDAEAISHAEKGKQVFPNDSQLGEKAGKTPAFSQFLLALQGRMFNTSAVTLTSYYVYLHTQ